MRRALAKAADYYHEQPRSFFFESALDREYFTGLLPAVSFASQQGHDSICITDSVNEPYIYVLFSTHLNPSSYLKDVVYLNRHANAGQVLHLDRYGFGLNNCPPDPKTIYVLSSETPPQGNVTYTLHRFDAFTVYIPDGVSQ